MPERIPTDLYRKKESRHCTKCRRRTQYWSMAQMRDPSKGKYVPVPICHECIHKLRGKVKKMDPRDVINKDVTLTSLRKLGVVGGILATEAGLYGAKKLVRGAKKAGKAIGRLATSPMRLKGKYKVYEGQEEQDRKEDDQDD